MQYIKKNKAITATVIAILLILLISGARGSSDEEETISVYVPTVDLFAIGASSGLGSIKSTGEVASAQRFDIRSQMSETVEWISADIGDAVSAGQTIVQLNNDSLLIQRQQLRAAAAAEQALLEELESGTRPEQIAVLQSQLSTAGLTLSTAVSNLNSALTTAYTQADDLVHNTLDTFFYDSNTLQPDFIYTTNSSQIERFLQIERITLENILTKWEGIIFAENTLENTDLAEAAIEVETDLAFLRQYLGELAEVVNDLTPSSAISSEAISALKAQVSGMRTTVNGAITALSQTRDAAAIAESQYEVAANQLALAEAGSTEEQIAIQKSRLTAAEANLNSNQLALRKASASSPIYGTIAEILVEVGDLVSPGQLLFRVINKNALSVKAFLSPSEALRISVGDSVTVENTIQGVVSRIAPSVNTQTQKVELEIGIDNANSTPLIDGQFVNVNIQPTQSQELYVPLTAVKTIGTQSFVYGVTEDGTARSISVITGEISGDSVQVVSDDALPIYVIQDSRDIDSGDSVRVRQ